MKKRTFFSVNFLLLGLCQVLISAGVHAQNTQVTVSQIRSDKGQIVLNVFKDQQSYDNEQPFKQFKFDKTGIEKGTLIVKCELAPGTYGITLLDDENSSGKMEKNMVRMPKEGFGFSNFFMEKLKKPSFDDFKTELKKQDNKLAIKVKYM
ncbi:MAG: DUF2141 domain-containing protein [Dyadobacter sp.]